MEAKFTPGPWSLARPVGYPTTDLYVRSDQQDLAVCKVIDDLSLPVGLPEQNARLISCAPEMYEALLYALVDLKELGGRVSKIERVLAKVRGEI